MPRARAVLLSLLLATTCALQSDDDWLEREDDTALHSAQADGVPDDEPGHGDGAVPRAAGRPQLLALSDAPCEPWCATNEKSWQIKCEYKHTCAGCQDCAAVESDAPCVDKSPRCPGWRNYCFDKSKKRYRVGTESLETFCLHTCTGCAATPTPPPSPAPTAAKKTGSFDCVKAKSVAKCAKCMATDQCASGYCCPYMKKCVESASTGCSYPIASCRPMCHKSTIAESKQCSCSSADFPSNWVGDTCT